MKKIIQLLLLMMGIALIFGDAKLGFASDDTDYGIVITKYKVNDKHELESIVPTDGTKAEDLKSPTGEALETLAGVSYQITRVSPTEGTADFKPVEGQDAFNQTITTNSEGVAEVHGLSAGTYQVVELNNNLLKEVMEPVIMELPLPQRNGEALSTVYLYPKSGVVVPSNPSKENPPGSTNPPSNPNQPGTKTPKGGSSGSGSNGSTKQAADKIPQTSGNIGNYQPFMFIFGFLLFVAAGGFYMMKKSKNLY